MSELDRLLQDELTGWPVGSAGVAVVGRSGPLGSAGDPGPFPWASVTKLLTALTILHACQQDLVSLDDATGPGDATLRHLLAHASGLARDTDQVMAPPGRRRIYSNRGIEIAAEHLEHRVGRPFGSELQDRVLTPLDLLGTRLAGSPAHGAHGPVADLASLAAELLSPKWFSPAVLGEATRPVFAGLDGLLPGFGRQQPNDWGLGFEIRGRKQPHWTSPLNAETSFGHFGQSGSFLWVDPEAGIGCVAAGDTPFGPWAAEAWPRLATRVLQALRPQGSSARRGDANRTRSGIDQTFTKDEEMS